MKTCTKCGEEKPLDGFGKKSDAKDGLMGMCKPCNSKRVADWQKANKEKHYANTQKYRQGNGKEKTREAERKRYWNSPEKFREKSREWSRKNAEVNGCWPKTDPEKAKAHAKNYREKNPHKNAELCMRRKAAKDMRTPSWLTEEHEFAISEIYELRKLRSEATGVEQHVDHIVPLRGKTVSGLHVPWNLQVIPASENLSKSNSFAA